ncbi:UDP-glucuronosyltransferase 2B20 [Orchesella cincta]|uniref:UDP-glucuronosyltransferase n=1 Tax=Orchesella cincta TaxID=48709 RepID=A0A1D2MYD8_ORCCI|nr:UDP-glucuronosyltransferase 2B20 [Orchesella cincta]
MSGGNMFQNRRKGKLAVLLNFDNTFIEEVCHKFYQNEEIIKILKAKEKFDLAFVNAVPNQCVLGLVNYLSIPHIYLGSLPLTNSHIGGVGGFFPRSFIPSPFSPFVDKMTFLERVMNFIIEMLSGHLYYQKQSAEIYRKYLGSDIPTVEEIDRNVSMIFMNTNFLLTFPRPLLPDIVEVGGMHLKQGRSDALPSDLEELLSGAKHGFIYFSLGSIVRTKNMPPDVRQKFINVFSKLKQLVIWKWDNESEADLPDNVVVRKWLPQQAVLDHPNIKLFITHGGLLSTQESVYYGVPLLGAPLYVDQDLNMKQAERLGYGLTLEITDFTEESLEDKINTIVSNPSYAQKAKQLSQIFRDQPETPTERAVFWTEYVIRHKGASHLRSGARELTPIQYHSLDVILFLGVVSITSLSVLGVILFKVLQTTCSKLHLSSTGKTKVN